MHPALKRLENKDIHVVGIMGAEGSSVCELLIREGFSFVAHELSEQDSLYDRFASCHDWMSDSEKRACFDRILCATKQLHCGSQYLQGIESAEVVIAPQSFRRLKENAVLLELEASGTPFLSMTQLYFHLAPGKTVGVTGTNGKSTTSALIAHVLREGSSDVLHSGNDRKNKQHLYELSSKPEDSVLVLEVSNRQLLQLKDEAPHISVVTNVTPNHLDDHGTFSAYIGVKEKLVRLQGEADTAVLNYDDPIVRDFGRSMEGDVLFYSTKTPLAKGAYLHNDTLYLARPGKLPEEICRVDDLQINGDHNLSNALAASLVAHTLEIDPARVSHALTTFKGLGSRLELIHQKNGLSYIEDSAGCNPVNLKVAVESMKDSYVLITGGYRTNPAPGEYDRPCQAVYENPPRALALIGDTAELILKKLKESGQLSFPVQICSTLEEALNYVESKAQEGDTILFAPGSESFGMFKDYRDRAKTFRTLVGVA